ncbi:MAG: hypothetical protein V1746_02770 [bacterium]
MSWSVYQVRALNDKLHGAQKEYDKKTDASWTIRDQLAYWEGYKARTDSEVKEKQERLERLEREKRKARWDKVEQGILNEIQSYSKEKPITDGQNLGMTTEWIRFVERGRLGKELKDLFTNASIQRCYHLIEALDACNKPEGMSPLAVARSKGRLLEVLDVLSQPIAKDNCPPFILSVQRSHNACRLFHLIGENLSHEECQKIEEMCRLQGRDGETALVKLAKQGDLPQAVDRLLSIGINKEAVMGLVSIPNHDHETPLSIAHDLDQGRKIENRLSDLQKVLPFRVVKRRSDVAKKPCASTQEILDIILGPGLGENRKVIIDSLGSPDAKGNVPLIAIVQKGQLLEVLDALLKGATREQVEKMIKIFRARDAQDWTPWKEIQKRGEVEGVLGVFKEHGFPLIVKEKASKLPEDGAQGEPAKAGDVEGRPTTPSPVKK